MKIRKATKKDVATIWKLTRELAKYENDLHICKVTPEAVAQMFFGKKACGECYLMEHEGKIVGMGKLLTIMDTYKGIPFFMLRDFIVREKNRGKGYGKQFLEFAAALAHKRGYGSIQWGCYDWNEPTLAFYRKMGATTPNSISFRLNSDRIKEIVKETAQAAAKRKTA